MTTAQEQLRQEVRALEVALESGTLEQALRSLDERGISQILVSNQYSGRYPLELLQNASDAASTGEGAPALVRFDITETALLASNTGGGFTDRDVQAICSLGRTSKDPAESIGYKGLGFKAVGEITDTPQILSGKHRFMFDAHRARELVRGTVGELPTGQRIPTYAFPFHVQEDDLGDDALLVARLAQDGYVTVLRLPFKAGVEQQRVEDDVLRVLDEKVLLLLPGVSELAIEGPRALVRFISTREAAGRHARVTLTSSHRTQSWLVFDTDVSVTRDVVVEALGEMWGEIDHLRVTTAIPVDGRAPAPGDEERIRVFFPTEERTGLPFVLHADFALELDRRYLGRTSAARTLNASLLRAAANFTGTIVAEALVSAAPESNSLISTFSPRADPSESVGEDWTTAYTESMRLVPFIRCLHGHLHAADSVLMLPPTVPPASSNELRVRFDLDDLHVVAPEALGRAERAFLSTLGVEELPVSRLLERLRPVEGQDRSGLFEWLIEWELNHPALHAALANSPCVPTIDGTWLRPADGALFPPDRKETPALPSDLPLAIASLPDVDGVQELLQRAGVKPWSWRDLLLEQVLPLLTDADTPMTTRIAAWKTVGLYLDAEGGGDQTVARRFGRALLPARRLTSGDWELRRADSLYFTSDWTGSSSLEWIYGPFEETEFLAFPAPPDDESEERSRLMALFRWMGVEGKPRILEAAADTSSEYLFTAFDRHPHRRAAGGWWQPWITSPAFSRASSCDQGHGSTDRQQLAVSFTLDRLPELVERADLVVLGSLFVLLAENWGSYYALQTNAEIRCQHGHHVGERARSAPSLFGFMLGELPWVPAVKHRHPVLSRPPDVWRVADDTPASVQSVLRLLDGSLDQPGAEPIIRAIGVVDGGRPRPRDLGSALREAREAFETGSDETARLAVDAARWLMRHLDDSLRRYGVEFEADEDIPLLARLDSASLFLAKPYYCDDQAVIDAWGADVPILDADHRLTSLRDALDLPDLSSEVDTEIAFREEVREHSDELQRQLRLANPFLAALALATSPSREQEVLSRLPRLTFAACRNLRLIHRREGQVRETAVDARLHEEVRQDRYRRSVGSIFVDDDLAQAMDWWSIGPLVAEHLQVPTLEDAFSILLGQSTKEKLRFLRSKHVDREAVEHAAELLDVGQEREDDRLSVIRRSFLEDLSAAIEIAESDAAAATGSSADATERSVDAHGEGVSEVWEFDPTPVDEIAITASSIVDAHPDSRIPGGQQHKLSGTDATTADRRGRPPRESELLAVGTWGEEFVFRAEQKRLIEAGFPPDSVVWVAKENPMSPYDLTSLDAVGRRIIIEVKSTTGEDPLAPFNISLAELQALIEKRDCSFIYRVTQAGTAEAIITRFCDPIGWWEDERARIDVKGASMRFSATADAD